MSSSSLVIIGETFKVYGALNCKSCRCKDDRTINFIAFQVFSYDCLFDNFNHECFFSLSPSSARHYDRCRYTSGQNICYCVLKSISSRHLNSENEFSFALKD